MKKSTLFLWTFIQLILLLHVPATANSSYSFTQIGLYQNMPSHVYYIYEDNNGLLWLGTSDGLLRYDGNVLKPYTIPSQDRKETDDVTIFQIIEDEKQRLWTLTDKGLFYYDAGQDSFVAFLWKDKQIVAGAVCSTKDGLIFSGTDTLYRYNYNTEQITSFEKLKTKVFFIRKMVLWENGTLLICSNLNKRLLFYDLTEQKETILPFSFLHRIPDFCIAPDSSLWITEYNQGIRKIDRNGHVLAHYTSQNSLLSNNLILCMAVIDGKIWVGTDGGGINIIDPANGNIEILEHESGNLQSLPVNTILYIHSSRKMNSIWVGTIRRGLINIRTTNMKTFQSVPLGHKRGLSEKTVISLYEEPDKHFVWIGTDGGGINRLETHGHTFKHYPQTWGDKIVSICNYSSRHLLLSIFSEGIFLFDKVTGAKKEYSIQSDTLAQFIRYSGLATNLYNETDQAILILAKIFGRYHIREKRFEKIKKIPKHGIIGMICPIGQDDRYTYFYDTQSIFKLEKGGNELISIYHSSTPSFINAVYRDSRGIFWIASKMGLYTFDQQKLTFIQNALFRKTFSIIGDSKNRIWLGTGQELLSYHPQENKCLLYGKADGALKNKYLPKPVLQSANGEIYMGGVNGLLCINTAAEQSLPSEEKDLPVIVTDFRLGEQNYMSQIDNRTIALPWGSRNIQMSFIVAGDDILRPRLFRYSLEENSPNITTNHEAELTIPSLAEGTYPIYVSYTQNDGSWSNLQQVLTLVILPPWYKSWWFNTLLIIMLGLFFYFLITFLLKRKEERLKWMLSEHEYKVNEEKIRFLINVSHELRTPLTLIYSPLKRIISSIRPSDPNYKQLTTAFRQSQRMKDLINMVLDVRKIEVGKGQLNLQEHQLNDWIKEVGSDFADEDERLIEYDFDSQIEKIPFDKDKCWTILSNLLINALKHTPQGKKITVRTQLTSDRQHVRVSISDQGPGLKDIDPNKLFTRFYQGNNEQSGSGIGLSYAKILVELHNGRIGACNNPDGGVTFYFELPLKQVQTDSTPEHQSSYLNELLSSFSEQDIDIPNRTDFSHVNPKEYTVLVADDNEELVEYIADELRKRFKRVLTAHDGQTAYQTACDENPDIIISDVMMPGMNGYELCKAIKEDISVSHIPIILLSARNDDESRKYGYMLGADSYLDKPFEMDQLVEKILNKLYNRLQTQKHYHQIGIHPVPEENDLSKADSLFMEKLHQVINNNLDNAQLDIPFLCSQIGISRASLYNKLKAIAGMGANDYINKIRIERAMKLIKETNLNFTEISEKVGFASPRYFSTAFKQYTGKTPTQFKKE